MISTKIVIIFSDVGELAYFLLGSPVRARNVLMTDRSSVEMFSDRGRRKASASSTKSTIPLPAFAQSKTKTLDEIFEKQTDI